MSRKTTLDNGLRVLTMPMPHTRSASIGLYIAVGSRYEEERVAGISHFTEHMLFKGTAKRPSARDVAATIEGLGGILNAGTGPEATSFWAKVPYHQGETAIELLSDILLHSRFEPSDMERERQVIIEEMNMVLDRPEHWVHLLSQALLWPGHPLGRDIAGTQESVRGITREDLLSYLGAHYLPQQGVLSVAGNVEENGVLEWATTWLGAWKGEETSYKLEPPQRQDGPRLRVENKKTEQAHLCLVMPGLERGHPDRYVLSLLNGVLGEGMSSRLFQEIRERRGLAYDVYSYASNLRDTGMVGIYAGVSPERARLALEAILEEQDKLCQEVVPSEEFERAREFSKGRLLLRMEDTAAVSSWYGWQELLIPEDVVAVDEVVRRLEAVETRDLQRLAQKVFSKEKQRLAVVGPFPDEGAFRELLP